MSYIHDIATAVPKYEHRSTDFVQFYCAATKDTNSLRKIKAVAHRSGIEKRYSVLPDFSLTSDQFEFFPKSENLQPEPSLSERMSIYKKEALILAEKAIKNLENFEAQKNKITHIITVTCTGLFAPGLDIELMQSLDLQDDIHRTSVNFMGCNAAILALKQAHYICTAELDALVLVVCVELCTLHFQAAFDDDYIISNQLFADGAAAVLLSATKPTTKDKALKINSFTSKVIHKGRNEMAWQLAEKGFLMNLTSYVSPLINEQMPLLVENILTKKQHLPQKLHWAVHPGGKRIVDDFAKTMNIDKEKLQPSYEVLRNFGNMSSPTILFVLKNLIENTEIQPNEAIVAAAFGPGLNIETMYISCNEATN